MKADPVFRVLVALPLASVAGRKKLSGIHQFLGEGRTWDIELVRNERDFTASLAQKTLPADFDGLIIGFTENKALRKIRREPAIPISFIDYPDAATLRENPFCVFIHDDAAAIAQEAARQLLQSCQTRTFGFVPSREQTRWSNERQQAFSATMNRHGQTVRVFDGPGGDRSALARWIETLPKPTGILAAFDDRANDVLEACRNIGVSIPAQVEVLGIGNDEPICEATSPRLSSIAVDFERQGYRAARELQAMMLRHRVATVRTFKYGVLDTVLRDTTANKNNPQLLVRRALDYIDRNAICGIGVQDVVRHLRVSRRLADLRFREETGTTILNAILTKRLDTVKRLLTETDLPISTIATRCGYPNANYLKNLFRLRNGQSMRDYRKRELT